MFFFFKRRSEKAKRRQRRLEISSVIRDETKKKSQIIGKSDSHLRIWLAGFEKKGEAISKQSGTNSRLLKWIMLHINGHLTTSNRTKRSHRFSCVHNFEKSTSCLQLLNIKLGLQTETKNIYIGTKCLSKKCKEKEESLICTHKWKIGWGLYRGPAFDFDVLMSLYGNPFSEWAWMHQAVESPK